MFILAQNNETMIGDGFMIYYKEITSGVHAVIYLDNNSKVETTLGVYKSKDDCIEQIGITMLQLADGKNVLATHISNGSVVMHVCVLMCILDVVI